MVTRTLRVLEKLDRKVGRGNPCGGVDPLPELRGMTARKRLLDDIGEAERRLQELRRNCPGVALPELSEHVERVRALLKTPPTPSERPERVSQTTVARE